MQRFIVLAILIAAANAQFCSRPGQIVPNPINCKEFFMCRTGRLILFSCPDNTLFNPRTMACDTTNRVRCELGDIPTNVLSSAIKANPSKIEHTVTTCINQPIASLLADHLDCSRFYQCSVTGSIGFQCPTGTLFDTRQRTCVERDLAVCGTVAQPNPPMLPTLPIQPPSLPVLPPSLPSFPQPLPLPQPLPQPQPPNNQNSLQMLCRGKPLGATVRNPLNCKQFVNCIGSNQLRLTTCPNGTAFDDVRKVCDWAQNVKC